MAIVPLTKDVSIKTIRDIINLKAVLLGQVRSVATSYGLYGRDLKSGFVEVNIKNISSSTVTCIVSLEQNGAVGGRQQTFTIPAGSNRYIKFENLPGKLNPDTAYTKGYYTGRKPAASYTSNNDYDLTVVEDGGQGRTAVINNINLAKKDLVRYYPIVFKSTNPEQDISIARDTGSITANYQLKDGMQIPKTLIDTATPQNAKLSDWRGAQVFQGTISTRTSIKGKYGNDRVLGEIHVHLDTTGFSNGPITVEIPGVKSITKNISTSDNYFGFTDLKGDKTYNVYIKDTITGGELRKGFFIELRNFNTGLKGAAFSFNGTNQFLAFTL